MTDRPNTIRTKRVGSHEYFHVEQLPLADDELANRIANAQRLAQIDAGRFNVIKVDLAGASVTLLNYPDYFEAAFPRLREYWTVNAERDSVQYRTFANSLNPPVLHRKELLLSKKNPRLAEYERLTETAEAIGLFDNAHLIGFSRAWEDLLHVRGYQAVGHELIPVGNRVDDPNLPLPETADIDGSVARHKTAMVRYSFSAPIQALARLGFLDGSKSVFDYGCGRGDDLKGLLDNEITARGWDPHFNPDAELVQSDIVNIGFVINVIEDPSERAAALTRAFSLANEVLVVSAMLASEDSVSGKPFSDGIMTSIGTFQKYYSQTSLREYIEEILHEVPLPIGPGVFFVFKDKEAEQRFLYGRQQARRNVLRITQLNRERRPGTAEKRQKKYEDNRDILEPLWGLWCQLGREPDSAEVSSLVDLNERFGSLGHAMRFLKTYKSHEMEVISEVAKIRTDSLLVFMAKLQFEKRRPYGQLEASLRRDVRAFAGDYKEALQLGRELLQSVGSIERIYAACLEASEAGLGWLDHEDSLHTHTSYIEELPPILRVYINCATVLYGDIGTADLVKIHVRSGKLTLSYFDDFQGSGLPLLNQRVKVDLRNQDFDVFVYGDRYPKTYLYRKSRFINEEFPGFAEQVAFEESLARINLLPAEDDLYGPPVVEFNALLKSKLRRLEGLQLLPTDEAPNLEDSCGRFLKFRDLIQCGETQRATQIANIPLQGASYTALVDLAENILDPVIEYFGMVKLTYGFCSHELSLKVSGRNDPKLDQHSALELNSKKNLICKRGGAAVDFLVEDEDMLEVARWIVKELPFDRLYFYGSDRPVHVSFSGAQSAQIVDLSRFSRGGNRVPSVVGKESFLSGGC